MRSSSGSESGSDDEGKVRPNVLLVEDDEDFRRTIAAGLASRGFNVIEAGSAEEALNVTARQDVGIDIVVLDVMLPDSWGPQVSFEQSFVRPDVKFIYITGYAAEDSLLRASSEDLPLLEKPFSFDELEETICRLLSEGSER